MRYYEWDPAKAAANLRKHGVRFETALAIFADPNAVTAQDRVENFEQRWQTLGLVDGVTILMVIHSEDDDDGDEIVRIISARRATPRERTRYDQAAGSSFTR